MALVLADRVKETTTTTGTGDISLGGAETNFVAFGTALSYGDTTYYAIADDVNSDFEAGVSGQGGEYAIDNSLRFNDDDSAYLSRTPASAGDRKTWT